jgi:hypothetical protein
MSAIIPHFILICLLIYVFIIFSIKAIHMPFSQLIDNQYFFLFVVKMLQLIDANIVEILIELG